MLIGGWFEKWMVINNYVRFIFILPFFSIPTLFCFLFFRLFSIFLFPFVSTKSLQQWAKVRSERRRMPSLLIVEAEQSQSLSLKDLYFTYADSKSKSLFIIALVCMSRPSHEPPCFSHKHKPNPRSSSVPVLHRLPFGRSGLPIVDGLLWVLH